MGMHFLCYVWSSWGGIVLCIAQASIPPPPYIINVILNYFKYFISYMLLYHEILKQELRARQDALSE